VNHDLYNVTMNLRRNLILIGMPGSGKSTIGRQLAQKLAWPFIDTDNVIKDQQQRALQDILDTEGVGAFIRKEAQAVMSLDLDQTVIATGGSVVLDRQAMKHLQSLGWIVYLDVPLPKIERRLWNIKTRGIVIKKNQSIRDIYQIRKPLYERYADRVQPAAGRSSQQIVDEIYAWFTSKP
jgi:shikimate kinase